MWIQGERATQRPAQWGDKAAQSSRKAGAACQALQRLPQLWRMWLWADRWWRLIHTPEYEPGVLCHACCWFGVSSLLYISSSKKGNSHVLKCGHIAGHLLSGCRHMITRDMLLYVQWSQDSLLKLELWAHNHLCQCIWGNSHQLQLKLSHFILGYRHCLWDAATSFRRSVWFVLPALSSRQNLKCTKNL